MRHVIVWILSVGLVALVGALGYMALEGWGFFDSLYMSVNTLGTTGFREVHPLDRAGEIWTMLLTVAAIGIIFGTVGVVAEQIVATVGSGRWEQRRMQKKIESIRDHFIVCGYGRVGGQVAEDLRSAGEVVVVIDAKEDSLARAEAEGFLVVHGNSASDEVLTRAGVLRARGLVTCIDSDSDNVYVTLTARALSPDLYIIGRAGSARVIPKLRQAGANHAVSPYVMAGHRITSLALRPGVVNFLDAALNRIDLGFGVDEIPVVEGDRLAGRTMADLRGHGVFVLAIHDGDGGYEPNPVDDRVAEPGVTLIVSGSSEVLREFDGG